MKQDVTVIRGTTNTFEIQVTDESGNPYVLTDGEKLLFGVKKKHTDSGYVFIKSSTSGESGVYQIIIEPADTEGFDCGHYFYDVSIESGENFYNVIKASSFRIEMNITKWGDG